ncbi:Alpha-amylase [Dactylella cylindrospora]|nr:Alpha-amylase [Dactylella cylindrospora]
MRIPRSCTTLFVSLLLALTVSAAGNTEWSTRKIYFAMTDRFARSDDHQEACSDLKTYCGGTWKDTEGGYHGYWAKNIYDVDKNLGSSQDLKDLVKVAHSMGIYMMVDVVMNHMGKGPVSTFTPFFNDTFYHDYCVISNYDNQEEVEKCRFVGELPDIKTEDPVVRSILNEWITTLVNDYGFDGLRIDTVRHVEKDFYQGFLEAAGRPYAIGEVFHADEGYVAGYQGTIPGLFNYPLYWALIGSYVHKRHFQDLVNKHDSVSRTFPNPELLGTFIDNHDVPRFMSQTSDRALLKNALAYVILARGIPIVYYGTEYGYMGPGDPGNREDLWRMKWESNDLHGFIRTLNDVKTRVGGLGRNDHVHLMVEGNGYVFSREEGKVIVVTSNLGGGGKWGYWFDTKTKRKEGEVVKYRSVLTGREWEVNADGWIHVEIEDGLPEVLVREGTKSKLTRRRSIRPRKELLEAPRTPDIDTSDITW